VESPFFYREVHLTPQKGGSAKVLHDVKEARAVLRFFHLFSLAIVSSCELGTSVQRELDPDHG